MLSRRTLKMRVNTRSEIFCSKSRSFGWVLPMDATNFTHTLYQISYSFNFKLVILSKLFRALNSNRLKKFKERKKSAA